MEKHERQDLDEKADKAEKCEEAAAVIKEYEEIIKNKKTKHNWNCV